MYNEDLGDAEEGRTKDFTAIDLLIFFGGFYIRVYQKLRKLTRGLHTVLIRL